jgi:hypothetical protein
MRIKEIGAARSTKRTNINLRYPGQQELHGIDSFKVGPRLGQLG